MVERSWELGMYLPPEQALGDAGAPLPSGMLSSISSHPAEGQESRTPHAHMHSTHTPRAWLGAATFVLPANTESSATAAQTSESNYRSVPLPRRKPAFKHTQTRFTPWLGTLSARLQPGLGGGMEGRGFSNKNATGSFEPAARVGVAKLSSQGGGANALNEFVKVK